MNSPVKNFLQKAAEKIGAIKTPPADAALPAPFVLKETKLMGQLQLSRDRIRELRQHLLTEGTHWAMIGNRVMLNSIGAEIIRQNKNLTVPEKNAAPAPASNAAQRPTVKGLLPLTVPKPFDGQLIAWAMPPMNRRLLTAYREGTDPNNPLNLVSVLVASNAHFMRGDLLKVTQSGIDSFILVGPCPRYRGEWKRKQKPAAK